MDEYGTKNLKFLIMIHDSEYQDGAWRNMNALVSDCSSLAIKPVVTFSCFTMCVKNFEKWLLDIVTLIGATIGVICA